LQVNGRAKNFNIVMSSDPYLSQEDIFSLLILGFTEDKSRNLEESDRASLTSVGIGSILFDRFNINQNLRSSIGVNVSVAPEFIEAQDSLLQGRSNENTGNASRLKTATRLKIQKQINDDIDVSVSSTIAGSAGQRQEMNVNYNISNNISLEGIYQLNSSDAQSETTVDPTSAGADLKFKWTFK